MVVNFYLSITNRSPSSPFLLWTVYKLLMVNPYPHWVDLHPQLFFYLERGMHSCHLQFEFQSPHVDFLNFWLFLLALCTLYMVTVYTSHLYSMHSQVWFCTFTCLIFAHLHIVACSYMQYGLCLVLHFLEFNENVMVRLRGDRTPLMFHYWNFVDL